MESRINAEVSFLNKLTIELNDLHERARNIIERPTNNEVLLLPVLVSKITSLTQVFEEHYNSFCALASRPDNAVSDSTAIFSKTTENHMLNLTWNRKAQIFSDQLNNYRHLLAKLHRESREVQSMKMDFKSTYSKFKNRRQQNLGDDSSSLYIASRELGDTLSQGLHTMSLLTKQNKRLNALKANVGKLARMVTSSDDTIIRISKYLKVNQKIMAVGFILAILLLFFIYYRS